MAEKDPQKSKRELFMERLNAKYPDRKYADDEELFGQINDDYAANDEAIGKYRERENQLSELFSKDPRSAKFITDMATGADPWIAVIKQLGIDGVTDLMNDPSKQEAYAEANKEYVERLAKEKGLEEEYQANFDESMKMLEQMQTERGLDDATIDAAMELIMNITHAAIMGKFTPETIDMALKAINHDAEVEAAHNEGVVAGKNAKIDETLRKPKTGDGLPAMGGTNNGPTRQKQRNLNIFDYAEAAK